MISILLYVCIKIFMRWITIFLIRKRERNIILYGYNGDIYRDPCSNINMSRIYEIIL